MSKTKIEWATRVWNIFTGCTKISHGCTNCYAERFANRKMGMWKNRDFSEVQFHPERLDMPTKWKNPEIVFVNSMSDLFHEDISDEHILQVFWAMQKSPHHHYLILTKRAERMKLFFNKYTVLGNSQPWVWLGVSVEDEPTAVERIHHLQNTWHPNRFLSVEPMLGPIKGMPWLIRGLKPLAHFEERMVGQCYKCEKMIREGDPKCGCPNAIKWVIVGGESGPKARPMHPDWAESMRSACAMSETPFFFKQWGEFRFRPFSSAVPDLVIDRVGKNKAGHLLDDKEYFEYPKELLNVER